MTEDEIVRILTEYYKTPEYAELIKDITPKRTKIVKAVTYEKDGKFYNYLIEDGEESEHRRNYSDTLKEAQKGAEIWRLRAICSKTNPTPWPY